MCTYALECIFRGSNFDVQWCSEMYSSREQLRCAPMFWNAFFEQDILKSAYVLKCIFEGAIILEFMVAA